MPEMTFEERSWPGERAKDRPDGWVNVHHGDQQGMKIFGPFKTMAEMERWYETEGEPNGVLWGPMPTWITVNWTR